MAQVFSLRPPRNGRVPGPGMPDCPSAHLSELRSVTADEAPMAVEFVGLTEPQKLVAIQGFPGGRRFVLATLPQRVSN